MDDARPAVDTPSKPPQRFRRTRIAVSVFFGLVTVALCVLWARSYWRREMIIDSKNVVTIGSNNGYAFYSQFYFPNVPTPKKRWKFGCTDTYPLPAKFAWVSTHAKTIVKVPYWLLTCVSLFISAACGLLYATRFSLRTMLIATTLALHLNAHLHLNSEGCT